MSDKPIDPEEVKVQGETYRQLNQKEIEENAAKLLILVEQGGYAAYRESSAELVAKGYQPQQITAITVCTVEKIQKKTYSAIEKLRQRIEEFRSLNFKDENS